MKKNLLYFILFYLFIPLSSISQENVFDQSLEMINKMNDLLVDCMASFLQFPEEHSNTLKIYDTILTIKNMCKEQQSSKYMMSNSILSHPKVQQYYAVVDQMEIYSSCFEELLRPFAGHNSAGLTQDQMFLLDPLFRKFGWEIKLLDIQCKDAYFYEYKLKGCKMMFIENTLPPNDYDNAIYNNIEVTFTYDYYGLGAGGQWYVGGGKYRMIQFRDNEETQYYKVLKAKSERKK